jgi:hypothetical protein
MIGTRHLEPWLTVVIPSYRGERWIEHALGSIAAECAEGIEVLMVDGGPTPAAREAAARFSDQLRLQIVVREDLGDWHAKVNFGVRMARAAHVSLLCVDDVWLPGRGAAVRAWIETDEQATLHLGPSGIVDRYGEALGVWRCPLPVSRELSFQTVGERLIVQNFIASPAPVFRKDAWLACGGLDEGLWYTADWDVWLKLSAAGKIYYHPEVTVGFRIHAGSLTMTRRRKAADLEQQMLRVLERHLPRLGAAPRSIERAARASIAVNCALAGASMGEVGRLWGAAGHVLLLRPGGMRRFLRDSRLVERLTPRLRARARGSL